jgi:hypothetical protein
MTAFVFDARTVQPATGISDPVPAGWYNVMIDETETKPTNDGQGAYISARFNILDGQYANRKLFGRYNIRNNNAQAQEIAYKELSAICHATGQLVVQDTQQLHGIPLKVKVSLRAAQPKKDAAGNPTGEFYEPSNDIKAYRNINEVVDMAVATAPAGYAQTGQAPQGFAANMPPQHAPQQPAPTGWGAPAPAQQPAPVYAPPAQQPAPAQPWAQQPQQPHPGAPVVQPPVQGAPAQPWAAQAPAQAAPVAQPQVAQAPVATNPSQPWAQQPQPGAPAAQPWAAQQPQAPGAAPPWAAQGPQG